MQKQCVVLYFHDVRFLRATFTPYSL